MTVLLSDLQRTLGATEQRYVLASPMDVNVSLAVNDNGAGVPVTIRFLTQPGGLSQAFTIATYNEQTFEGVRGVIAIILNGDGANASIAASWPEVFHIEPVNTKINVAQQNKAIFTAPNFNSGFAFIRKSLTLGANDSYVQMVVHVPANGWVRIRRVFYSWDRAASLLNVMTAAGSSDDGVVDNLITLLRDAQVGASAATQAVPMSFDMVRMVPVLSVAGVIALGAAAGVVLSTMEFKVDRILYSAIAVDLTYKLDINGLGLGVAQNLALFIDLEGSTGITFTGTSVNNGGAPGGIYLRT